MFRNRGLIAAMEEVENEVPAEVTAEDVVEEAVAVADESAEIQQDNTEAEVTVSEVEDAVQAGVELEEIQEVAEDSVEEGEGLSEEAAEMASIAIESIRNRLGVRGAARLVPATESFGNTNTRLVSTKLVIEGITDTLRKIWEAIKTAAKRIWDSLKNIWDKLTKSAKRYLEIFEGLDKKASEIDAGASPKEKTLKGSFVGAFAIDGRTNAKTMKTIIENTDTLEAVQKKMSETVNVAAQKLVDVTKKLDAEELVQLNDKMYEDLNKEAGVFKSIQGLGLRKEQDLYFKVGYFGNFADRKTLQLILTKNRDAIAMRLSSFAAGSNATEADALTLNECKEAIAFGKRTAQTLVDVKKAAGAQEKTLAAVVKMCDTVLAVAAKGAEGKDSKKAISAARSTVGGIMTLSNNVGAAMSTARFAALRGASAYVSASLANLGGAKAEAA